MIRKPTGDWDGGATPLTDTLERTAAVARQGRQVAEIGVRAAGTGLYTLQGLVCWGFALLWGACALGTLLIGEVPTAIGAGLFTLVAVLAGRRSLNRAKRTAGYGATLPDAPRADAREVRYSRSALAVALVASMGAAGLAGRMIAHTHGFVTLLVGICLIAAPVLAILCGIKLTGDPLALRWDARSVTIATLTKRRTLAWSEVSAVTLSSVTTYVWGVVPVGRSTTLGLKLHRGRSIGLTPGFLALEGASAADLAEELDRCRRGRAPAMPIDPTRRSDAVPDASAFDPDTIMARYLAEKQSSQSQASDPVAPPRRTFGRKAA